MNRIDGDAQTVAYLLEANWTRKQIAELLHIPAKRRDKLTRLIRHANERKWLYERFTYAPPSQEDRAEIERRVRAESREFREYLWRLADLHGVRRVVDVFMLPADVARGDSLDEFGLQAAACLKTLLQGKIRSVGVAWGTNLASTIRGLRSLYPEGYRRKPPIIFFAARGEPQCAPPRPHSASRLAAELHQIVNGGDGELYALAGVPAMMPSGFRGKQREALITYFESIKTFEAIAVGSKSLLATAGGILSSVGPADPSSDLSRECIENGGLTASQLVARTWGDLAGVHVAKQPDADVVGRWNGAWLGLQESHLKLAARRAAKGLGLGVVVVAASAGKGRIVLECLRRGLVSRLIIDQSLTAELKDLLIAELSTRRPSAPAV